ncbi:MAG: XdhC family protein, partial [Bacteroidota bacterium]
MKEITQIINQYKEAAAKGLRTALATVVDLEGSSYRRPGARMLVTEEGSITGAISGGCLEGDALKKAQLVIARNTPQLVTYDTSREEDASIGFQLGCAGVIRVLFEPLSPEGPAIPVQLLEATLASRSNHTLVTFFSDQPENSGTCMLFNEDGNFSGTAPWPELTTHLATAAQQAFSEQRSYFHRIELSGRAIHAFIQFVPPQISLVIAGAGNDAIPLSIIAEELGWHVQVIDGRHTHARPERFSASCQVFTGKPENLLEHVSIDKRTAVVMMTHNYQYDLAMLKLMLNAASPYLGMLGPRKKLERMIDELHSAGMTVTPEMMQKIYGPVGLNLGAETPEEIALSIAAEIQSVFAGKHGDSLRNGPAVIHDR